jgi:hypothetical protein
MQRSGDMESQLIPTPEIAPPSVRHLPFEKRIALWAELVDACDALAQTGLRNRIGPEGDLHAAYREWYRRCAEDHEKAQIQFLENLSRRERGDGD